MRKIVSYLSLIALLVILFFTFSYISSNEQRFIQGEEEDVNETIAYPECENKDILVSDQLVQNVKNFSKNYVIDSVGKDYWNAHYSLVGTNFSVSDCYLTTYYEFTYGGRKVDMWVEAEVLSKFNYQISDSKILLDPVEVNISRKEAKEIASERNVSYDEVSLNLSIKGQRYEYVFHKELVGEGKKKVLVVDAEDGEIVYLKRISNKILV